MTDEFTKEELMEVITGARAFNACFSEEEMETLTRMQRRLGDSGFLEAVNTLLKLEEEKGVPLKDVHDEYEGLVKQNEEIGKELEAKRQRCNEVDGQARKAQNERQKAEEARDQAKAELNHIQHEQQKERKELSDYRKKAEREKRNIDAELERYRHDAHVSKEEIVTAGEVKAEVTKHGFTLDLALALAREFSGYADAGARLAEALKKEGELTKHLTTLDDDIRTRQNQERWLKESLSGLAQEQTEKKTFLSQLDDEIVHKKDLVDFYYRYVGLQPLIEYLASGNGVTFHHCQWCGALFWVVRPGGIRAGMVRCPWCSLTMVEPDRNAYAAVSQPPGTPLKLLP